MRTSTTPPGVSGATEPEARTARGPAFHTLVRPTRGLRNLDLREVWRYRGLLLALARRDLTLRYRQTALGVVWVVLQPLLAAGIFSFVFGSVARFPSAGVPYVVFAFAGLLAWNGFSGVLASISTALVANNALVSKIYFPRVVLPLAQIVSKLLDFVVALALFVVMAAVTGVGFHLTLLTLPVWLLLAYGLALGLGLFVAALNVSYRDVGYIVPVLLPLLMYLGPVAYGVGEVPAHLRPFYDVNPLVGVIEGMRWCLLGRGPLTTGSVVYAAIVAAVAVVGGLLYFRSRERRFADVI